MAMGTTGLAGGGEKRISSSVLDILALSYLSEIHMVLSVILLIYEYGGHEKSGLEIQSQDLSA